MQSHKVFERLFHIRFDKMNERTNEREKRPQQPIRLWDGSREESFRNANVFDSI